MRKAEEIYQDAINEVLASGNQSLKSMALLAIEKAQKEMFIFLCDKSDENKGISLQDFFDKMERDLDFP